MKNKKIDWMITLMPLTLIIIMCVLFFFLPSQSNDILSKVRFFFGDTFGSNYLIIGFGIFILSLYIAFSKYGKIVLGGKNEKPKYSFFSKALVVVSPPDITSSISRLCSFGCGYIILFFFRMDNVC